MNASFDEAIEVRASSIIDEEPRYSMTWRGEGEQLRSRDIQRRSVEFQERRTCVPEASETTALVSCSAT